MKEKEHSPSGNVIFFILQPHSNVSDDVFRRLYTWSNRFSFLKALQLKCAK